MTVELPREFLDFVLKTADIHASRLRLAMSKLEAHIPLSADFVTNVKEENLFILELFSSRFAKLQDLMGAKVFGAVLEWSEEPGSYPSFLDKLHVLEKVGQFQMPRCGVNFGKYAMPFLRNILMILAKWQNTLIVLMNLLGIYYSAMNK